MPNDNYHSLLFPFPFVFTTKKCTQFPLVPPDIHSIILKKIQHLLDSYVDKRIMSFCITIGSIRNQDTLLGRRARCLHWLWEQFDMLTHLPLKYASSSYLAWKVKKADFPPLQKSYIMIQRCDHWEH